ncbi:MAG: Clp protease ClpP, partial [Spirochaetales bacterium]|nr:Clp protease ClpP [Spirochaetales bacterium]
MAPTALMMIHNPATMAFGDHTDMKKAIEMLDQVKESIINAYEIRTGLSRDRLSRLMDSETWMNAHKAIEMGFADALIGDGKGDADEEPYSFSQKQTNNALINKIATKAGHAPVEEMKGRSVNELMERLSLLRY